MIFWTRRFASMDTLWWSYCLHKRQGSEGWQCCWPLTFCDCFFFFFLPPSPAGRCCKQLPGPQPVGWGRFRSVTLSPAHLRSAAAPNGRGVGVARTERLRLYTHTHTGRSCSHQTFLHDLWICVYFYFSGPAFAFVFFTSAHAHLWVHRVCGHWWTSDQPSSRRRWWESFQQPEQHQCGRKLP